MPVHAFCGTRGSRERSEHCQALLAAFPDASTAATMHGDWRFKAGSKGEDHRAGFEQTLLVGFGGGSMSDVPGNMSRITATSLVPSRGIITRGKKREFLKPESSTVLKNWLCDSEVSVEHGTP